MLEMVQWSDRKIRESCLCKKYIIEEFSPQGYEDMDELQKAWFSGDCQMVAQIEGKSFSLNPFQITLRKEKKAC